MAALTIGELVSQIQQLPITTQLLVIEKVARNLRAPPQDQSELRAEFEALANDPDIQREIREINAEFAATDADGLDYEHLPR